MKRTTIFIDEHTEADLYALARRTRRPVASVVREAIAIYVANAGDAAPPQFIAAGRSGLRNVAAQHEELLWRDLQPHEAAPAPGAPKTKRRRKRS